MSMSEPREMVAKISKHNVVPKYDMHIYVSKLKQYELDDLVVEYGILKYLNHRLPPSELTMDKLPRDVIGATQQCFVIRSVYVEAITMDDYLLLPNFKGNMVKAEPKNRCYSSKEGKQLHIKFKSKRVREESSNAPRKKKEKVTLLHDDMVSELEKTISADPINHVFEIVKEDQVSKGGDERGYKFDGEQNEVVVVELSDLSKKDVTRVVETEHVVPSAVHIAIPPKETSPSNAHSSFGDSNIQGSQDDGKLNAFCIKLTSNSKIIAKELRNLNK
ncbi:hypothetical protein Tco_0627187 [Tanacetum coccineum]|uniref:DUF4283 domain-containing protein n=1 Tax=Tanacetum coccineum TaxID=301880 RepID=A0ABQ4WLU2_9ASTR